MRMDANAAASRYRASFSTGTDADNPTANIDEPIIQATIKEANMNPNGGIPQSRA